MIVCVLCTIQIRMTSGCGGPTVWVCSERGPMYTYTYNVCTTYMYIWTTGMDIGGIFSLTQGVVGVALLRKRSYDCTCKCMCVVKF